MHCSGALFFNAHYGTIVVVLALAFSKRIGTVKTIARVPSSLCLLRCLFPIWYLVRVIVPCALSCSITLVLSSLASVATSLRLPTLPAPQIYKMLFLYLALSLFCLTSALPIQEVREIVAARQYNPSKTTRKRDTSPQPSPLFCDLVNYELGMCLLHHTVALLILLVDGRCEPICKNGFLRDSHGDCTKCSGEYEVIRSPGLPITFKCVRKCTSFYRRGSSLTLYPSTKLIVLMCWQTPILGLALSA